LNARIAEAVDKEDFDVAFVKDCHLIMNPYVLRYLRTPSVFQCHHGLRHRVEAARLANPRGSSLMAKLKTAYYVPAQTAYERRFARDEVRNIRSATRVLTNSQFSRDLIAEQYGVDAGIIYPGINTRVFYPSRLPKLNYVLSVGALIYSKGHRFLVAALSRIPAARRPPLLIAANSIDAAEAAAVHEQAARQNVEVHIETIGDDERLREVYSQALVFIYAPIQEALGMAPLEALACGTPVVAVHEGGIRETLVDGVTGWSVGRDEQAFAERVDALLTDERARRMLGDSGSAYVRSTWTWQSAVDRLIPHLKAARTP
jgi:glycosyltransferase involved in cell wall biosynthesis